MTKKLKIIMLLIAFQLIGCSTTKHTSIASDKSVKECPIQYASTLTDQNSIEQAQNILESKYPHSIFSIAPARLYIVASYVVGFRSRIEYSANKRYPNHIKNRLGAGQAVATVAANGQVLEINLLHSTGDDMLDEAFLTMVCPPDGHPPFSEELRDQVSVLHITLPFSFEKSGLKYK